MHTKHKVNRALEGAMRHEAIFWVFGFLFITVLAVELIFSGRNLRELVPAEGESVYIDNIQKICDTYDALHQPKAQRDPSLQRRLSLELAACIQKSAMQSKEVSKGLQAVAEANRDRILRDVRAHPETYFSEISAQDRKKELAAWIAVVHEEIASAWGSNSTLHSNMDFILTNKTELN